MDRTREAGPGGVLAHAREAVGRPRSCRRRARARLTSCDHRRRHMTYAIIGFGAVGQALAKAFARKGVDVRVASRRPPEALAPQAQAIGPTVRPVALDEAVGSDVVILAVPFSQVAEVAHAAATWEGRLVIDATNAYGTPLAEFGGLTSSAVVARAFLGARVVKGFNHLPAAKLAADPDVKGGRRVIFTSSDDPDAQAQASSLMERLGYAPVVLGPLAQGAVLAQAQGNGWAPLAFQDLVRFG
ncbi:NADPH-dependent F420 reductase [Lichenibacterium ramalinae]|uniref:NADPH-dependent F420 reductase n=1 Tax=Lichenibacterium ramalinae TaxID=2316527 RepID=UPI001FDEF582|nr:NAD(P)-binding domain-containing protein [Lichenibacterium ramalinae]